MRQDLNKAVEEILGVILEVTDPVKVILFGSAARGDAGPNSDLDFLVIVPDEVHRRKTTQEIYENMLGIGKAKDIVVVTESDVEQYEDSPALVVSPALDEGEVIYDAAA